MTADPARVATAHLLLTQLGVTLAHLHNSSVHRQPAPSMAEYLPRVVAAASPAANRLYGTYWNRMAVAWGDCLATTPGRRPSCAARRATRTNPGRRR